MLRRTLPLVLVAVLMACKGSDSPSSPGGVTPTVVKGTLAGVVKIGPICPVETTNPCPTPPDAYAARKVLVYDSTHANVLNTVDINSQGLYTIDLAPGAYVVDLLKVGIDRSSDVPKAITIAANTTTRVDISIDTGIR